MYKPSRISIDHASTSSSSPSPSSSRSPTPSPRRSYRLPADRSNKRSTPAVVAAAGNRSTSIESPHSRSRSPTSPFSSSPPSSSNYYIARDFHDRDRSYYTSRSPPSSSSSSSTSTSRYRKSPHQLPSSSSHQHERALIDTDTDTDTDGERLYRPPSPPIVQLPPHLHLSSLKTKSYRDSATNQVSSSSSAPLSPLSTYQRDERFLSPPSHEQTLLAAAAYLDLNRPSQSLTIASSSIDTDTDTDIDEHAHLVSPTPLANHDENNKLPEPMSPASLLDLIVSTSTETKSFLIRCVAVVLFVCSLVSLTYDFNVLRIIVHTPLLIYSLSLFLCIQAFRVPFLFYLILLHLLFIIMEGTYCLWMFFYRSEWTSSHFPSSSYSHSIDDRYYDYRREELLLQRQHWMWDVCVELSLIVGVGLIMDLRATKQKLIKRYDAANRVHQQQQQRQRKNREREAGKEESSNRQHHTIDIKPSSSSSITPPLPPIDPTSYWNALLPADHHLLYGQSGTESEDTDGERERNRKREESFKRQSQLQHELELVQVREEQERAKLFAALLSSAEAVDRTAESAGFTTGTDTETDTEAEEAEGNTDSEFSAVESSGGGKRMEGDAGSVGAKGRAGVSRSPSSSQRRRSFDWTNEREREREKEEESRVIDMNSDVEQDLGYERDSEREWERRNRDRARMERDRKR